MNSPNVPTRLSDFVPEDRTPRQNWGKFKAHKWGGFTGRLDRRKDDDPVLPLRGGGQKHELVSVSFRRLA